MDRRTRAVAVAICLVGFFEAIFLGPISENVLGITLVNPLWGSLYGFGAWLWQTSFGFPRFGTPGIVYFIGTLILYPIAVFIATVVIAKKIARRCDGFRWIALLIISLLLLIAVNQNTVSFLRQLPLMQKYLEQ